MNICFKRVNKRDQFWHQYKHLLFIYFLCVCMYVCISLVLPGCTFYRIPRSCVLCKSQWYEKYIFSVILIVFLLLKVIFYNYIFRTLLCKIQEYEKYIVHWFLFTHIKIFKVIILLLLNNHDVFKCRTNYKK